MANTNQNPPNQGPPNPEPEKVERKPATKSYKVLGNLRHGGNGYRPGASVDLTAKAAKTLLDLKVVAPIKEGAE